MYALFLQGLTAADVRQIKEANTSLSHDQLLPNKLSQDDQYFTKQILTIALTPRADIPSIDNANDVLALVDSIDASSSL